MTEEVQKRMELMANEIAEMLRIHLFTPVETRNINKACKEFEHKIHSHSCDLKSYIDYIAFEKSLLKDIKLRRDKLKVSDKKSNIEHKILKRIKLLYETGMQRYPLDIPFLLRYIKFCKKMNYVNAAADAVANMLKNHPNEPKVWQIAANFHVNDRKDVKTAVIVLLKGLAIHRDNEMLYMELIQTELNAVSNVQDEVTRKQQQRICVEKLKDTVNAIFREIKSYNFYIEILHLLEEHHFTWKVQEIIIERLKNDYSDVVYIWDTLAQRIANGCDEIPSEYCDDGVSRIRTPKARYEATFAKYREGIATVSPEKKTEIWALFIDYIYSLQGDHGAITNLKVEILKEALREAAQSGCLTEKHYLNWLDTMSNNEEKLGIAIEGTTAIPQSLDLWRARLRLQILGERSQCFEVDKVFKMGIEALKEKSLPLWSSILRYHYLTSTDELIQSIYEDGVKQPKEISDTLKPKYIEWLALSKGIDAARRTYRDLAEQKPYCKDLHLMMSKHESLQIDYDFKLWEEVHMFACEQFGKEDVDVWINYIQFYLHFNKNVLDLNATVQRIHKRAKETLSESLHLVFDAKYKDSTESA